MQSGLIAIAVVLLATGCAAADESEALGEAGRAPFSPRTPPFADNQLVDLATVEQAAPFRIHRPHHALASDSSLTEVWLETEAEERPTQVALWYASGLEVHLQEASVNDPDPLAADYPPEIHVSYQTIGGVPARVIPGGIQGPQQPGSVALLMGRVVVTLYGWVQDLDVSELVDVAATVR